MPSDHAAPAASAPTEALTMRVATAMAVQVSAGRLRRYEIDDIAQNGWAHYIVNGAGPRYILRRDIIDATRIHCGRSKAKHDFRIATMPSSGRLLTATLEASPSEAETLSTLADIDELVNLSACFTPQQASALRLVARGYSMKAASIAVGMSSMWLGTMIHKIINLPALRPNRTKLVEALRIRQR